MTCPNSHRDCIDCPFKQDPNDPQRWVCIKCGRTHSFRRSDSELIILFIVVFVISLITLAALREPEPSPDPVPAPPTTGIA
ncbi:MAG: hypothetical protein NZ772_15550 [Cyanobacteria bacterium]|nr:hypothetical protein [Cyanobacteriota bacterium]MDW8202753.1 hypothetical protein [Cyanobacteriota bacterium SKYGB_h_bin112]